MITTIIFDLDDTLYDEIDYCKSGFTAVARFLANGPWRATCEQIFNILWEEFTAGNRKTTFNAALDKLGRPYDDDFISELITVFRNHRPKITLPVDSRDVLDLLSGKYILALITDGFLPAQQLKVEALGIEGFFKCVIYTEQLGREFWKPSAVGFEKIMQTLDVKPECICYVADNLKKDFIAPNQLGFTTIQLQRPARLHTKPAPVPEGKPQLVIKKISQLPALLEKL